MKHKQMNSIQLLIALMLTQTLISGQSNRADFFNKLIRDYDIPGLSVAIIESDKVVYSGAHGVKATDSNEPVDRETIFSAASLSKPCFAYGVMKLVNCLPRNRKAMSFFT